MGVIMKTFKQFLKESNQEIETIEIGIGLDLNEESTSSSTVTGGIANPDAKPLFNKSKFMGQKCLEVDDETYSQCIQGKQPFKRWTKYTKDSVLRDELRSMYNKNKRLLIKNSKTGGMVYIK
jgi:hypothetical protein